MKIVKEEHICISGVQFCLAQENKFNNWVLSMFFKIRANRSFDWFFLKDLLIK